MNISELTIGHIGQRIQVEGKKLQTWVRGTLFGISVDSDKIDTYTIDAVNYEPGIGRSYIAIDIGYHEGLSLSKQATFILEGEK